MTWQNSYALEFAGIDYQSNFPSLCESCSCDGLIMILGLQWILVEFLAFHLVVSPILTLATEQITALQVFSTEFMFAIPNFVADPIYSRWIFRPIHLLI